MQRRLFIPMVGVGLGLWLGLGLSCVVPLYAQQTSQTTTASDQTNSSNAEVMQETDSSLPLFKPMPMAKPATPAASAKNQAAVTATTKAANHSTVAGAAAAAEPSPDAAAAKTHSQTPKHLAVSARNRDRAEALDSKGERELLADHPHRAMLSFERAAKLDPENPRFVADAAIAREHWVTQLVQQANRAKLRGHAEESERLLQQARKLDPHNPIVEQHFEAPASFRLANLENLDAEADQPQIDPLARPITLDPLPGEHSFALLLPPKVLIPQVLHEWGIEASCDNNLSGASVRFYAGPLNFKQALQALELATNTFMVPLDPARALFIRDTEANRTHFERYAVETLPLKGITQDERTRIIEIAQKIFNIEHVTLDASQDAIVVRAPAVKLNDLNQTLQQLLEGQSQILLNVRMYEIDLSHVRNLGLELPDQTTVFNIPSELNSIINNNQSLIEEIISSGLASPNDYEAIAAILIASGEVSNTVLSNPFAYFGGGLTLTGMTFGNGSTLNGGLTASDVRTLDQMQLLAENNQDEEIRSGTRYPIITSSYSSISASSSSIAGLNSAGVSSALESLGLSASSLLSTSETVPQIQYQNLGLTLNVTPTLTGFSNVQLKFDLKLDSLAGETINDIPVLNSRQLTSIINVKPGTSVMIVSNMSRQLANTVSGLPGLSELPGLGAMTNSNPSENASRLVIVVTPQVVRRVHPESMGPLLPFPNQ